MAIVIEAKEKKGINWFAGLMLIVFIIIVGITAYLLFFSKTPLLEQISSPQLNVNNQISQLQIQSQIQAIAKNQLYQSLKEYATLALPSESFIGKANPFTK
ncbi:MAG: hypothetical protein WC297_01660 [Candidatus Paceibacterota bacterium]|jgi:flagellar basal body-associated protein FliL